MKSYAGIGSRRTPLDVLHVMTQLAEVLERLKWTLRTGGAPGADQAFLKGTSRRELYLPWPGFEGYQEATLDRPAPLAYEFAESYHPAWSQLTPGAKHLMARNVHQILGEDLMTPSWMVVCWTPDGSLDGQGTDTGGTGQALRIAADRDIPVYNLARQGHLQTVLRLNGMEHAWTGRLPM